MQESRICGMKMQHTTEHAWTKSCARWYHPPFSGDIQGQMLNQDWHCVMLTETDSTV